MEVKGQGYDVEIADVKDYDPEDSLALEVSPVCLFCFALFVFLFCFGGWEKSGVCFLWVKPLNINCDSFRD